MTQPTALQQRIPALDGLRAVSILLVIFSHVLQTYHWTQTVPFVWRLDPGATGVSVFFVISGYLITTLLLREQARNGHISPKGFYVRRFFRIVPAYLVFLATVALLKLGGVLTVEWRHFAAALLYVTNYLPVSWPLLHTWSLSVEEQFYLLFPLLLIYSKRPTLITVLSLTLGLSVLARLLNQVLGLWPLDATYSFEGRADQLAFGCLCAVFQQQAPRALQDRLSRLALPVSAVVLCAALALPLGTARTLVFNTLIGLAVVLAIHACTRQPTGWLTRLLSARPLQAIGLMSYSLYLWQQLWLAPELRLALPLALAGTLASGAASYWLVEKTALRLRAVIMGPLHVIPGSTRDPCPQAPP
jgi:peptidoglycan/LPS O-acetylase OafA/YrhL